MTTASEVTGGRANQKTRTRRAIIDACRELVRTGADVTMPEVARRARGTPRIALRLLRRVRDYAQVRADGTITAAVATEALDLLQVDPLAIASNESQPGP